MKGRCGMGIEILLILGLLVGITVVSYSLAFSFAKNKIFFSLIKEGEIEYRMRGESLKKIIVNVRGYGIKSDSITANISGKDIKIAAYKVCPEGKPPRLFFGMAWVGLFYPYDKILAYSFAWNKPISSAEIEKEKGKGGSVEEVGLGDMFISHRSEKVNSLYFRYTYSIVTKNVELKGRYPIDIGFNIVIEAVYPVIPVIYLKGQWFSVFQTKFDGFISDSIKGMEPDKFEEKEKAEFFQDFILEKQGSFIKATGMMPVEVIYKDYQSAGTTEEKEAFSKKKVAELNKEARIVNADATGKEIEREGAARKAALLDILAAAKSHPDGAEVLKKQLESEAVKGFTGQFLNYGSGGGQGPLVTVNAADFKQKNKKEKGDKP
ncbi:MAG: hypothetical protein Q8Q21_01730 [bacterium]|nr:hypothetical protein [bacterium]